MLSSFVEWWKRRKEDRQKTMLFESSIVVADIDGTITVKYPSGEVMSITWEEIDHIAVHTNDSGPWGADVWWILKGNNKRCGYPQGASGEITLISKFQKLDGFNNEQLITAMRCTSNAEFVCWVRNKST